MIKMSKYHPDLERNIAMGYVPYDGTLNQSGFPTGNIGQEFEVHLPDDYAEMSGQPVRAKVVPIPLTKSENPNTREVIGSQSVPGH